MLYISTRVSAGRMLAAHYLLSTDIDLSFSGIKTAFDISLALSAIKPNVLILTREDYFLGKELLEKHTKNINPKAEISLWVRDDLRIGYWLVGSFEAPTFFVGSRGA